MTPLELEREEGYLIAGARSTCAVNDGETPREEMVERLIREEVRRQHHGGRTTAASDHHAR